MVSSTHEQNIICSKTLIGIQLFTGHVVGSRLNESKAKKNTSNDIDNNSSNSSIDNNNIRNIKHFNFTQPNETTVMLKDCQIQPNRSINTE